MAGHGGKRSGAGRPKGSKNNTTIARAAVAEVLDVDVLDTLEAVVHKREHSLLLELERIAHDPTRPLAACIKAARVTLPFLLPRREVEAEGPANSAHFAELIQQRRKQVSALRHQLFEENDPAIDRGRCLISESRVCWTH